MLFVIIISACSKTKSHDEHVDEIREYIQKNGYDAVKLESGLFYSIIEEGTGLKPKSDSKIRVNYKGYLLDGTVFDTHDTPNGLELNLQGVILGWQEGLLHFREGSTGMLFIPPDLGYGKNRVGQIPPHSVLIFEITLTRVF
ncbi:MAG: FKBP-type peptidyl-prolyl cis-trans isomerase [Cryomorphaceae bacterium]|nr:FKBP-type peptidyl-prolyl cis-trans isomerase [Cryomorphaceae bacterium]